MSNTTQLDSLPTRTEEIRVHLELDYKRIKKFEKEIREIGCYLSPVTEGDTYKITWSFLAEYHGRICRNIQNIRKMVADPKVITKVTIDELNHGESLIVALLDELRKFREDIS